MVGFGGLEMGVEKVVRVLSTCDPSGVTLA